MLAERRSKMRKQVRADQLNRKFALQRKALLEGRPAVFLELLQEVLHVGVEGEYELGLRVLRCAEEFPQEENSYILLGNCLIKHPQLCQYFEYFLTAESHFLQNYVWCLHMLLLCYFLDDKDSLDQEMQQRLRGIAIIINDIGREMKASSGNRERAIKAANMQSDYFLIVKELIQTHFNLGELLEPIKYSLAIVSSISQNYCSSEQLRIFFEFLLKLRDGWQFMEAQQLETYFTSVFAKIALACLRNLPQKKTRINCMQLLHFLLEHQKETHLLVYLPIRQLLTEVLYLMSELAYLREPGLLLMKLMLEEASLDEVSQMLQLRVHVQLTRGMEQAMRQFNNDQLTHCLSAIYHILNKLQILGEEKLLHRVKEDIEKVDFHLMIQGLIQNDQNEIIGNLVNHIADDFYTEEEQV